jgi:hypothetical protein
MECAKTQASTARQSSGELDPASGQSEHHADFAIPLPDKMAARFKGLFTNFDARDFKRTRQAEAFLFR